MMLSLVSQVLFGADDDSVVYPCHSLVVDMEVASGRQRFFIGHTDKVEPNQIGPGVIHLILHLSLHRYSLYLSLRSPVCH